MVRQLFKFMFNFKKYILVLIVVILAFKVSTDNDDAQHDSSNNNNVCSTNGCISGLKKTEKADCLQSADNSSSIISSFNNMCSRTLLPKTTPEILLKFGYDVETHEIVTEDSYILTVFRIVGTRNRNKESKFDFNNTVLRKPILLQHCILGSSDIYVLNGENSLGILLYNAGYDVWLSNTRGTSYSKRHVYLSNRSKRYWNFSWHEMGVFDIPAIIDYILKKSNFEKLYYVGFSMGNTMAYVMLSCKPEYNEKINILFSLSPVAHMTHLSSWGFQVLADFYFNSFFESMGVYQSIPPIISSPIQYLGLYVCPNNLCVYLYSMMSGYNSNQLNETMIPSYIVALNSVSGKGFRHYGQVKDSGEFRMFDYGYKINLKVYNSEKPPIYRLDRITTQMEIFHGQNDIINHPEDVFEVIKQFQNKFRLHKVSEEKFAHMDFVYGVNAKELVYDEILEVLKKH